MHPGRERPSWSSAPDRPGWRSRANWCAGRRSRRARTWRDRPELAALLRRSRAPYRQAPLFAARAAVPSLGPDVRDARPVRRYLDEYAADRAADLGRAVAAAHRADGGGVAGTATTWSCRVLVVATGIASSPFVPTCPGQESFGGRIRHSIDYHRPEPFAGGASSSSVPAIRVARSRPSWRGRRPCRSPSGRASSSSRGTSRDPEPVPRRCSPAPAARSCRTDRRVANRAAPEARLPPSLPRSDASPLDEIPLIGMHLPDAISGGRSSSGRRSSVHGRRGALRRRVGGRVRRGHPGDRVPRARSARWDVVTRDPRGFARRSTTGDKRGATRPVLRRARVRRFGRHREHPARAPLAARQVADPSAGPVSG